MVATRRKRRVLTQNKVEFKGRSYKNYVKEDMQEELLTSDWAQFYETGDPSDCWEIILNKIRLYLNRSCPQKSFKVKEIREPWITNEIIEEIKDKDRALKQARRSGSGEDWVHAKTERIRVGRVIETAKADFLKEQQVELSDDPKKFWRLVKDIVPGKRKGHGKISLLALDEDGQEAELEGVSVAGVHKFFCSIGPKLAKDHREVLRDESQG